MVKLKIVCPTTQQLVDVGLAFEDEETFQSLGFFNNEVDCPLCLQTHRWQKKDVILEID